MKKFLACPSYIVDVRSRKIQKLCRDCGGWVRERPRATTCARHASGRWPNSSSLAVSFAWVPSFPWLGAHKQLASSKNMLIIACAKGILALVRRARMRRWNGNPIPSIARLARDGWWR
jgi:hypothetical protein